MDGKVKSTRLEALRARLKAGPRAPEDDDTGREGTERDRVCLEIFTGELTGAIAGRPWDYALAKGWRWN